MRNHDCCIWAVIKDYKFVLEARFLPAVDCLRAGGRTPPGRRVASIASILARAAAHFAAVLSPYDSLSRATEGLLRLLRVRVAECLAALASALAGTDILL